MELSIVLVILGLLTGGILAGQSLIRAAELRSVMSDYQRYRAAYYHFRDKYMALPGDMANATRFWGTLAGDGYNATCQDTAATGLPTCNGNGDGRVRDNSVVYGERFRAWQHLANAGMIEGSYTGTTAGASGLYSAVRGSNVPAPKIGNAYWDIFHQNANASIWFASANMLRNFLTLYGLPSYNSALTPEEAWNIDSKLDDGSPATGNIIAPIASYASALNCTTSDDNSAGYNVTDRSKRCFLPMALD